MNFFVGGFVKVMDRNKLMMQDFEWYLKPDKSHWKRVEKEAEQLKEDGVTAVWLPPAYKGITSFSPSRSAKPSHRKRQTKSEWSWQKSLKIVRSSSQLILTKTTSTIILSCVVMTSKAD